MLKNHMVNGLVRVSGAVCILYMLYSLLTGKHNDMIAIELIYLLIWGHAEWDWRKNKD
ncbi:hypothetical protein SK45_01524 [Enterobacter hormaechei]|nr:hypothetical protein SK45_01524 [Enterobacter hormaechei]KLW12174.1 hypothetical protein SK46_00570 [Enterobacter hormaechei]